MEKIDSSLGISFHECLTKITSNFEKTDLNNIVLLMYRNTQRMKTQIDSMKSPKYVTNFVLVSLRKNCKIFPY